MSDFGSELSPKQKIETIYDSGVAKTFVDAYWFLVDMGEIEESDVLRVWANSKDVSSLPTIAKGKRIR